MAVRKARERPKQHPHGTTETRWTKRTPQTTAESPVRAIFRGRTCQNTGRGAKNAPDPQTFRGRHITHKTRHDHPFNRPNPKGVTPPKKIQPHAQNCGTNGRSPKTHYKIHRQTSQIPINPPNKGVMTEKRPNRAENHADHPPKTRQSWGDTGDAPKMDATPSKTPRKLQKTKKNNTENQNPTARQQIDQTWIDGQNSLNENTTTEKWTQNMARDD